MQQKSKEVWLKKIFHMIKLEFFISVWIIEDMKTLQYDIIEKWNMNRYTEMISSEAQD